MWLGVDTAKDGDFILLGLGCCVVEALRLLYSCRSLRWQCAPLSLGRTCEWHSSASSYWYQGFLPVLAATTFRVAGCSTFAVVVTAEKQATGTPGCEHAGRLKTDTSLVPRRHYPENPIITPEIITAIIIIRPLLFKVYIP